MIIQINYIYLTFESFTNNLVSIFSKYLQNFLYTQRMYFARTLTNLIIVHNKTNNK